MLTNHFFSFNCRIDVASEVRLSRLRYRTGFARCSKLVSSVKVALCRDTTARCTISGETPFDMTYTKVMNTTSGELINMKIPLTCHCIKCSWRRFRV